jgi:hypothetical protein
VPFLELWPAHGEGVRVRRRAAPPPVALALAILATLLALLAAGRPVVRSRWPRSTISVVVDRGYTMSARGRQGTRASELLNQVSGPVTQVSMSFEKFPRIFVPKSELLSSAWPPDVPTALDTRDLLNATLSGLRSDAPDAPVMVLTDHALSLHDDRTIVAPPMTPVRNARIVTIAARETPAAQVMVRIRGGAGFGAAKLRVASGDQLVERDVQIPESGERDEFVGLAKLGASVRADLLVDDDLPADDTAWLAREASWPRIEARQPLPAHLQRMVDVYRKERPPGAASRRVAIVPSAGELPNEGPAVVVPRLTEAVTTGPATQPVIGDHPLTRGVTWTDVGRPAVSTDAPPAGWTPVVSDGGRVWVAAREQPVRAVWVGFDSSEWARSPAFVVFWANVFNWAGAGGDQFSAYPVGSLDDAAWKPVELAGLAAGWARPEPKLWPGLYQRSDGLIRAINAPDLPIPPPPAAGGDWQERLAVSSRDARQVELTPMLAAAAVACLALAAWTWKRRVPSRSVVA